MGASIISGGVPGVDLAAHLAAAEHPSSGNFAVLANPVGHRLNGHEWQSPLLERQMEEFGGFLSEYDSFVAVDTEVFRERLLQRDRIISGLCNVLVVFECNLGSATVDTAYRALAQGKRVFAVTAAGIVSSRVGIDFLIKDKRIEAVDIDTLGVDTVARSILNAAESGIRNAC